MRQPILTIAFDDGYNDTYRYAVSHLDNLGIKCTFAVPAGLLGKSCEKRPVVKWTHLKKMYKRGHDIASHTLHHIDLLKTPLIRQARKEIISSGKRLRTHLGGNITSFVYPYINRRPIKNIQNIVKSNYTSSRISENFPVFNKLPVKNPFSLKGFCINSQFSLKDLEQQIKLAIKSKSWLIEVFHLVGKKNTLSASKNTPYRFFMHIDDFKRHIDFVLSKKVQILTQLEVPRRCS